MYGLLYTLYTSSSVYACATLCDRSSGSSRYAGKISRLLGSPSLTSPLQVVLPRADTDLADLLVQGLA